MKTLEHILAVIVAIAFIAGLVAVVCIINSIPITVQK